MTPLINPTYSVENAEVVPDRYRNTAAPYQLAEALHAFVAAHNDSVICASHVIIPLLALWDVARDESEAAARPIERILTVLVSRQHTSRDELARMVDEVEEAARSNRALPTLSPAR